MNLGYINYLNCFPFYYEIFESSPPEGVNIIPAYPGELNRMMKEGKITMSPVSAAAYSYLQKDFLIQKSIPIDQALYWLPSITISNEEGKKLLQGNSVQWFEFLPFKSNSWVKIYSHNHFIGLARFNQNKRLLHPGIIIEERSRHVL